MTEEIKAFDDATLKEETLRLTAQVGSLLKRREDCMEELYSRGLIVGGAGMQPLADRVANMLGLKPPKVEVTGQRERDESGFWTSARNIATLVEAFIKAGFREIIDDDPT